VLVVLSCHRAHGGSLFRIADHIDLGALRRLAAERLRIYYVDGGRDIFEELPEGDWGFILYQWGTGWMTHQAEQRHIVQDYVFSLIDANTPYLGRILRHMCQRDFPGEVVFRFEELAQVYDPAALYEHLERHEAQALIGPEERKAAELFRRQYAAWRSARESSGDIPELGTRGSDEAGEISA
jgi:hypothetical protein